MAENPRRLTPAAETGPREVRRAQFICPSREVDEGGEGVRFEVARHGQNEPAFVIRWKGHARAYLNRCGHIPVEMDYQPGKFFDFTGQYLVCATHGALYDPATGACLGGRCNGTGLVPIPVLEEDGGVYLQASNKEAK
ncbi:MAG: Rieske 2Fe-2S domain-containing protein [Thiobacillus sp.]|nr:Rieske 2Fe-2S domain-containing protein [Thiobacillus sp.]